MSVAAVMCFSFSGILAYFSSL